MLRSVLREKRPERNWIQLLNEENAATYNWYRIVYQKSMFWVLLFHYTHPNRVLPRQGIITTTFFVSPFR